ncbi:MAG TPA: class I SAM-dependent methyltransferase [bacterium]|nr:class I SAM-dependent methyltransferase [bacterium]
MNPVLEDIYRTGKCVDLMGKERKVTGAVPREDALILQEMVKFVKAKTTLETGVAFGLSTLAICEALTEGKTAADCAESGTVRGENWGQSHGACGFATVGTNDALDSPRFRPKHYGVDPEQNTVHGGAALASLKRAGLDSVFELLEGPSHLMLPKLLEKGVVLDLGFIDGWHTFDYTLLDFFYIDKMLRPGGVVLLHDQSWPSKQKVIKFITTHRRYKELPVRSSTKTGFFKWLRRVVTAKWHWLRGAPFGVVVSALANRPEIAAFVKLESFEPDHRFFRNF